jgi:23S rRNA (uridine2552-2'-O)-methyltransferase
MPQNSYEKPDFWANKAKEEGYPARSVYKLKELNEKFKVLKPGQRVLDLGAAPGSWSLFVLQQLRDTGWLTSVDLSPIVIQTSDQHHLFLRGDMYAPEIRAAVMEQGPYDLVISDAAPATTGNSIVDTGRSEALVELAIDYAREALKPGGCFIAKIFQGGAEARLLNELRTWFESARGFKPKACRAESFETYLVALHRK